MSAWTTKILGGVISASLCATLVVPLTSADAAGKPNVRGASKSSVHAGGNRNRGTTARNTGGNRNTAGNRAGNANRNANANRNNNVNRNTNVNRNRNTNINVDRDIDVDVHNDWDHGWDDHYYHPIATAAAVTATAIVVGSIVNSVPPNCSTVVVNGISYSQCGSTWYEPRYSGSSVQYVVVNSPY